MARPSTSVANSTLYAGRNPPSPIFITRASGSVVDTRASVVDLFRAFTAWSSGKAANASATRASRSRAARASAAAARDGLSPST